MKIIRLCRIVLLMIFIFAFRCDANVSGEMSPDAEDRIRSVFRESGEYFLIYISKKDFMLRVYDRDLKRVAGYKVGYGLNPDKKAKLYAEDNRTPEGVYKITEILSLDADKKSVSYTKLRDMNTVYFRAKDGHYKFGNRNADLGINAYGPRFFRISYPNPEDRLRYNDAVKRGEIPKYMGNIRSIGEGVAIHGNCDKASIGQLGSSGCIRMYNEDIVALDKYIKPDLPVIISWD